MKFHIHIWVGVSGADTGNLIWGVPGSFCRGGCRIGGSRAQIALKMFSHRAHYTCRFREFVRLFFQDITARFGQSLSYERCEPSEH